MRILEKGFTLIELLISITLGLILVAVAIQLLLSGQINYRIQQGASTIQDNGVFSLNAVTKNIRLANHGNSSEINDETLYGGIVLSAQAPSGGGIGKKGNLHGLGVADTVTQALSQDASHESGFGSLKSDQLVIIYQTPLDMMTCTGINTNGPRYQLDTTAGELKIQKGWYVIERYYIKKNPTTGSADLYCSDALFLAKGEDPTGDTFSASEVLTNNYAINDGQMVAANIDYMRVQLIVKDSDNQISTLALDKYSGLPNSATKPRANIIGVNLGWLVRSSETVPNIESKTYQVLDQPLETPADNYMRHVYTTTIALRNGGLGDMSQ